jgi:ubiquinone/menaquinone biosynthesis C-methylase UbiE
MPSFDEIIARVIPEVEYHQNRYARGLAQIVRPGCRWLDLGAGTRIHHGWIGVSDRDLAARARVLIGCDMVGAHLAQNSSLTAAVVADAKNLPFASESFDLVTANMVLEHIEDPCAVMTEVARVLVYGGRFVFVTPNRANPVVWLASILLSRPARKAMAHWAESRAPEHIFYTFYRVNSLRSINNLAKESRLTVRALERFNSYPNIRSPWPLTVLESLWIKLIRRRPLQTFLSNLFGELEKTR